jgi:hypothetical protein
MVTTFEFLIILLVLVKSRADPSLNVVLLEDSAAATGVMVCFLGFNGLERHFQFFKT